MDFASLYAALGKVAKDAGDTVDADLKAGHLDEPDKAGILQRDVTKWSQALQMQTAMIKELGDALKGVIQKIN
jgi:type III secretion apparatus needle protein